MKIKVFYDNVKFRLKESNRSKKIIEKVIRDQNMIPGDLNFIFTGDKEILEINRKFLKHDYFTDVISFDYNDNNLVNGEIYISTDTVKRNAVLYSEKFNYEILRVMIHGSLHLCGYEDKTDEERSIMNGIQDRYLEEFKNGE